ncbi:hypothetical protein V6307_25620 [Serratia marcescens]|uniref:hypothetical protein n=1 Tax=Serratia marcescens TaxID=615 RepID=UPI00370067D3
MKTKTKERIGICFLYLFRTIGRSLKDIPWMLFILCFLLLVFFPEPIWTSINQIWHQMRPLTDREAVILGNGFSTLLAEVWFATFAFRFIMTTGGLVSQLNRMK